MKKRFLAVLVAGLILTLAAGCGSSSGSKSAAETVTMDTAAVYDYEEAAAEEVWESPSDAGGGALTSENGIESVVQGDRKLIKTVRLELQTREFDSVLESLTEKVKELNGYVEESSIYGSSYYYESTRSADYTVRIPSDKLNEFVSAADELGNITYKNEDVQDVTLQYVDVESRKKALETEQERLLELLEQAENMEDLLAIESKLSEVRYELENYGSQLRVLDNQIDYSTVYVNITEVERITEAKERTFFEEVSDRFGDSLYSVGRGLRSFAIGFLGSLPILAVWAVVIVVIVLIVRGILRINTRRHERKLRRNLPGSPSDSGADHRQDEH